MQHTLFSDQLHIHIDSKGAEITSVRNKDGLEFIWQADPNIWPRHAPILFPIVGKLKDGTFIYDDKEYELGQHGFARDKEFELIEKKDTSCTFQLCSDEIGRASC